MRQRSGPTHRKNYPPGRTTEMADLFERLRQLSPPPATEEAQKPRPDPKLQSAQRMLDWIQRWAKDTICIRDVRQYGPSSLRNPKSVIDAAEVLYQSSD